MNGGANVWAVTPEERLKHDQKFDTLAPSMGYVSGEQARKFFLQSGLPASVLAEIWALADMNKDGKMDRLEFSIAMKLVKLKLQGTPLPSVLPGIMKQPPVAVPNLSYGMMQNMSLMPGTNLSMFTPVSMATPGPTSLPSMAGHNLGFIQPMAAGTLATGLPLSASSYGSPLASSATLPPSSMTAQMAAGLGEWGVPHASRLKYRQHFNVLDKQMTGYLTGQQVRGAMATTMLSQTQLASIWNLADVDKDGKLSAEEFILAMHLVDVAKSGQPLPRTLPTDLVPPTQRSLANGSSVSNYAALYDNFDVELTQQARSNMSFEDKFKANMDRGNAELEKRRLALLEAEKKEQERQAQKAREEQERREKEAREAEERRRKEEERRLERQRELERKREEERQREIERKEAAQRELERQRKEEFQRRKRGELQIKRQQEQDDIIQLKAKKRSLEMELEAVGNKQRQISDRLHDIQNKKKLPRTELDLVNQRKDARHLDIKNIQQQIEEFQKKLALLSPEQKRLTETLQSMAVNNLSVSAISNLKLNVNQKRGACTNLKTQLEALERETAAKLEELDRYNKNMQELKASQQMQQAALENLRSIKEDKKQELIRKKQEHEERRKLEEERRRQEEEAQRLIKLEKERQWKEKLRRDEEERQRRLQEEREAKQREEEEKERQALIQAAKLEAERELRAKQEEERKRREEEERKKREEEERRRQIERQRQEEERRKLEEERRQLEAERKKLEEDKRMEERKRKEEEERLKREEERRRLEEERLRKQEQEAEERRRLEEERRKEMERVEEERRRQRAAQAAVRDSEERRRLEEEERRRKEQQEEERRKREEEKRKLQHQQEDDRRRREEERKRAEEDRKRKVQEEEKKRKEHQSSGGGKIDIQEKLNSLLRGLEERKGRQPRTMQSSKSVTLTPFRSLYPFTARNHEELTFNADEMIEVDETVEPEEGWLYGHRQGLMGWFPKSYVERVGQSDLAAPAPPPKLPIQSQLSNALEAAKVAGTKSAFTPTHSPNSTHSDTPGQQVVGNLLAQALCSWTAKTDNHLNFEKDDVIQVLEQQDSWWLGNLKGEQGWFPKSYVTLVGEGDSSDVTNSTSGGAEMSNNQQFEEYTALYPYESSEASDLTFREGDVILVTKKDGEWWNGVIADRSGAFPGTYVKPKEADVSTKKREIGKVTRAHSSSVPGQLNLENGQLIVVLSKDASGWWLGEQQARGKKRQKGWFPSSHIQILASNSGKSTPAVQSGVCQVIALYDYVAANKDDLSFSANQLITVLDKSNPDWWKGEVNGATGLFPTNYVKMITGDGDPSHQ